MTTVNGSISIENYEIYVNISKDLGVINGNNIDFALNVVKTI